VHERVFQSIISNAIDGIIGSDDNNMIFFWNKGAENIFGYAKEEVLGKPFTILLPPVLREKGEVEYLLRETVEKGYVRDFLTERVRKDGRKILVNLSRTLIRDEQGAPLGTVAIVRDITAMKELEKQVQQSEKLALVGQIAAGIAHEIGTPLSVISGNAEYMLMDMKESDQFYEEMQTILSQTERITKLIRQLLEFARPRRLIFEDLDVNAEVKQILDLVRHQCDKNKIALRTNFTEPLPAIHGDKNQLQQVFLNIVMNAIQAMESNGIDRLRELTIQTAHSTEAGNKQQTEEVSITFSDTGCGIPEEFVDKVFDPFFTTKDIGKGTGLGLAVSQRIIDEHKGTITVASEEDRGTTFTLRLPLSRGGF
jgi:two-component system sensor histidine kinase AtoS